MIAYLRGEFTHKTPSTIHVDVNGIGYEVHISLNTYAHVEKMDKGTLLTHLIVREDAQILYGFFEEMEREMFINLISVSGIGASTARIALSYMKPDELARAIADSDTRSLERIKGIGKKTAERMVVELRDKMARQPMEINISPVKNNTLQQDALNALTALGINRQAADQAIAKALHTQPGLTLEGLIKHALRTL